MMVNVVRPNGMIEFGNKADEVRPHEAGVRVLFASDVCTLSPCHASTSVCLSVTQLLRRTF